MNQVKVKICGLKRKSDISLCARLKVDIVGLVVEYPLPVHWNLTSKKAGDILAKVKSPMKSCVVTGGDQKKIIALAKELRPNYIQLHFRETLADSDEIAKALSPLHIKIIKTLPFSPKERYDQFGTEDITTCVKRLNDTEIYAILADTGKPANSALYYQIQRYAKKPVILAGGITPDNLTDVLSPPLPAFIDIMTGVEASPGIKDEAKLTRLMQQLREI